MCLGCIGRLDGEELQDIQKDNVCRDGLASYIGLDMHIHLVPGNLHGYIQS
jgi:hypothetical protein